MAVGAVALRFREAGVGELPVGPFAVVAFCLSGDGVAVDDCVGLMIEAVLVLLRFGESANVSSYEYCCNAAPKLSERAPEDVILCQFLN